MCSIIYYENTNNDTISSYLCYVKLLKYSMLNYTMLYYTYYIISTALCSYYICRISATCEPLYTSYVWSLSPKMPFDRSNFNTICTVVPLYIIYIHDTCSIKKKGRYQLITVNCQQTMHSHRYIINCFVTCNTQH